MGEIEDLVYKCVSRTAHKGFFTCVPCDDLSVESLEMEFIDVIEDSICGYFEPDASRIRRLLEVRSGHEDREWIIGSCLNRFVKPHPTKWLEAMKQYDLSHLLNQAENIGCLFYQMDNIVTVMCRPFDDIGEELKQLVRIG